MKLLTWVAIVAALVGCAAVPGVLDTIQGTIKEKADPEKPPHEYRADLDLYVGGTKYRGLVATKVGESLDIGVVSPIAIDRVQVSSCARMDVCSLGEDCTDPRKGPTNFNIPTGFFGAAGKSMSYRFIPSEIERGGLCPVYFEVLAKQTLVAWGYLGIRNDEALPAKLDCNGERWSFAGYSVCQTKSGKTQLLQFSKPVVDFETEEKCGLETKDNQRFTLKPKTGLCRATFYDGVNWHTLNLFGYEKVLVRQ